MECYILKSITRIQKSKIPKKSKIFGSQKLYNNFLAFEPQKLTFSRKAQAEIVGFIIIVIIVVVGIMFMLFMNKDDGIDNKSNLFDSQLSQSLLNVISRTQTSCETQLSNIIADCFEEKNICDVDSCDLAKEELDNIMQDTLIKWGKPFHLFATQRDLNKIDLINGECDHFTEKSSSGYIFISSEEYDVVLSLDICKN